MLLIDANISRFKTIQFFLLANYAGKKLRSAAFKDITQNVLNFTNTVNKILKYI